MIMPDIEVTPNGKKKVTRLCDNCGKKKEGVSLKTIYAGRKTRGADIDLCANCAYSKKYKSYKRGEQHHCWKHGLKNGYSRITTSDGRRGKKHRFVYEAFLGRGLSLQEVIHHIDLDRKNNALDNLVLFKDNSSHRECHQVSLERCTLSFLNNGVWFDFRSNEYTLRYESDACERSIKPINLSGYEKKEWKEPCYRYADDSGRYVVRRCHVVIAEKTLGRSLYSNEIVHHLDGNYLNNVPDNLVILTKAQHYRTHYSLQICGAELLKSGLLGFSRERLEYFVKIVD